MKTALVIVLLGVLLAACDSREPMEVFIYTKNGEGYVHDNIQASVTALEKICTSEGILCQSGDDPSIFTPGKLASFDAIIFSNTNNEAFNHPDQKAAFQEYIRNGGGFMGIHSANASERQWPWYRSMVGGKFLRHPPYQPFDVVVIDSLHPSTMHLPGRWTVTDECYYSYQLNPSIHVLLAADLSTVEDDQKHLYPGDVFDGYFPVCWCQQFEGGRQWYTALGHDKGFYEDPDFVEHLRGGLRWVLEIH